MIRYYLQIFAMTLLLPSLAAAGTITIGSKTFTESYLLAEIFAQWIEANTEHAVERRFGLDTKLCFDALRNGEIDLYPEYTGTIREVLLKDNDLSLLEKRLQLTTGPSLGFNNTYVLAVHKRWAEQGLAKISDLKNFPEVKVGVSHQFLEREDGWRALAMAYQLPQRSVVGVKHALAYEAILSGDFDLTDAYSTDGKLSTYPLILLEDDKQFFPEYLAVPLLTLEAKQKFPELETMVNELAGKLDAAAMQKLNALAEERSDYASVAAEFLGRGAEGPSVAGEIWRLAKQHFFLTGIAVSLALVIGLPLGIVCARQRKLATPILALVNMLQTIPSIALLAFMIPILGIGTTPAIVALLLYGLLPIVQNTYTGIREASSTLCETAESLGLSPLQRLVQIELPLALPMIFSGIKICTVISIGTATLAAFIGAGGFGEPIVTGLAMNDSTLILRGAIPAAVLALCAEYGLRFAEKNVVSPGLRYV